MQSHYLGIEIGGTKLQLIITDEKLRIIERHKAETGEEKKAGKIRQIIKEYLDKMAGKYSIAYSGIGFGGPVDPEKGLIHTSYQVEGWDNFDLKGWMKKTFDLSCAVENDATTAGFAEAVLGKGENYKKVFYITIGSGIGGGFVINKEIYHGSYLGEAEIGHIRLDKNGSTLESKCSGWAIDKKLKKYIQDNPDSTLSGIMKINKGPETRFVDQAIRNGDQGAKRILDDAIDDLSFGISHIIHLLNPHVIIIGGGVSLLGERLIEGIRNKIDQYLMSSMKIKPPVIHQAGLKEDVVPLGAALLAQQMDKKKD